MVNLATFALLISTMEEAGAKVVGERTIEYRDECGGFSEDVLDYRPDPKVVRKYLVLPLPTPEEVMS